MFLNKKDDLITFIKYIRKYIRKESFEDINRLNPSLQKGQFCPFCNLNDFY